MNGPLIGVIYHWLGGLAAGSFYIPYRGVRRWSWETYWLVGGVFSWLVAPWIFAALFVPGLPHLLLSAPPRALGLAIVFGVLWGVGGLTYGLALRYLGLALGVAVALGCCAVFGTLIPPLVDGSLGRIASSVSGRYVLIGVGVCVLGIGISSLAGISRDRDLPLANRSKASEFNLIRGLLVATFAGIVSSCFAYGLAAGKPLAALSRQALLDHGRSDLWQNLPVLIVVLLGGFCTNCAWCVWLNVRNRSAHEYLNYRGQRKPEAAGNPDSGDRQNTTRNVLPAPLAMNYLLSAAAGVTWYLQFFFYGMGQTKMGRLDFSSWTLHRASIILFSTLWGIALKEWAGTSRRTRLLVGFGILSLVGSTVIVGYGNYVGAK